MATATMKSKAAQDLPNASDYRPLADARQKLGELQLERKRLADELAELNRPELQKPAAVRSEAEKLLDGGVVSELALAPSHEEKAAFRRRLDIQDEAIAIQHQRVTAAEEAARKAAQPVCGARYRAIVAKMHAAMRDLLEIAEEEQAEREAQRCAGVWANHPMTLPAGRLDRQMFEMWERDAHRAGLLD